MFSIFWKNDSRLGIIFPFYLPFFVIIIDLLKHTKRIA